MMKRPLPLLVLFFAVATKATPFCPSAPPHCHFQTVQKSLADLNSSRCLGALKSPDNYCKGVLDSFRKNSSEGPKAIQSLALDQRFTSYLTPQIAQCWKESSGGAGKAETLARSAYLQKRFDDSASQLVDYLTFADSVAGADPLKSIANCQALAPELAETVRRCDTVKKSCKGSQSAAKTLAQNFISEYNQKSPVDGKSIADLDLEMDSLENEFESKCGGCLISRAFSSSADLLRSRQQVQAQIASKKQVWSR